MTPKEVIDHYGSQVAAAEALGMSQPAIADWVAKGKVPILRQYQIAMATGLATDEPAEKTPPVNDIEDAAA